MKFDTHIHSTLSGCSQLRLDQILTHAKDKGLDGVCITDHDTMAVRHQLTEGIQSNGLCVIFGMEYTTMDGDFLLFGPYEELVPGLPSQLLLQHVENTGGVAVAAHPFRRGRSTKEHIIQKNLCRIVEGINGRNSDEENKAVQSWGGSYNITQIGGSDAHTLDELGKVPTEFTAPVTCRTDFIQALRSGEHKEVRFEALSRMVA